LGVQSLGQHLNGEEAIAQGAGFIGANSSTFFKVRKVMVADSTSHDFGMVLEPVEGMAERWEEANGWKKEMNIIPKGHRLNAKKSVKVQVPFDLTLSLSEDGSLLEVFTIKGVEEAMKKDKYKDLGVPTVTMKLEIDLSGIVRLPGAEAVFEEIVQYNETKVVPVNTTEPEGKEANETETASAKKNTTTITIPREKTVKHRVPLAITRDPQRPLPMSEGEKQRARDRLYQMEKFDELVAATGAKKNELEAYIYSIRAKLEDDDGVKKVSTFESREALLSELSVQEEWMYDEGFEAKLEDFRERLSNLQSIAEPILERALELEARESLPEWVQDQMAVIADTLNTVKVNRTWVNVSFVEDVQNKTDNFTAWFNARLEDQKALKDTEEPAYKAKNVRSLLTKVVRSAKDLLKIKKVAPPKKDFAKEKGSGYESPFGKFNFSDPNFFENDEWKELMANFSGRANGSDSDPLGSFNASEFAEKLKAAGAGEEEAKAEDEGKVEVEEEVVNAEKTEL